MTLLFWFRALWARNFYNWNAYFSMKEYRFAVDLSDIEDFNIGQQYMITSVNRTTGRITVKELD